MSLAPRSVLRYWPLSVKSHPITSIRKHPREPYVGRMAGSAVPWKLIKLKIVAATWLGDTRHSIFLKRVGDFGQSIGILSQKWVIQIP